MATIFEYKRLEFTEEDVLELGNRVVNSLGGFCTSFEIDSEVKIIYFEYLVGGVEYDLELNFYDIEEYLF